MLDSHYYIIIELGICALITLGLLLYYVRKNVNILVFFTAYIAWLFNFALIVFLPFDIYYTQIATDSDIKMSEMTRKMIEYGYTITYWTLFIFSWIFIPLMQCYESSGEFTKLAKLKSSLKENIIYYSILALISIAILIFAIIKTGFEYTLELAKDCSLIIGILFFFFLLSYSLIKYPKTLYQKLNYINLIKYHEWRANQFFEKLDEIKFDLINRFLRLRITIQNLKDEENNKKESINTSIITEKSNKRKDNSSISMELSLSDKTKQLTGYLEIM